jgi:hypothetical protein
LNQVAESMTPQQKAEAQESLRSFAETAKAPAQAQEQPASPAVQKQNPPARPKGFSTEWGKWGGSVWPEEFRAAPGMSLEFHQSDKTVYRYALVTTGLPEDKTYRLWQQQFTTRQPSLMASDLSIKIVDSDKKIGFVAGRTNESPVLLDATGYVKGEVLKVALVSEDKTVAAHAKIIPFPIESIEGPYRIWVELGMADGNGFTIYGEGFEEGEELVAVSTSEEEVIQSRIKAGAAGRFMAMVFPAVTGKESGSATYAVRGKSGEVKVDFQWGSAALAK